MTETQAQSAEDTGAGNAELNKLYEKENAIIAKHQELWNTVFNNIDKNKAADAGEQNYGTFLETQLDHVKDQFSEADLKKLDKDIEEIKKIEDQVTELTAQMGTENSGAQSANAETSVFPSFQAKDLDGNKVDSSIFSQNAVTVVNFWFNGCTPCVEELPALNKLNEELKAKGGQVIGVNTDSLDGNKEGIAEAKSILKNRGQTIPTFPLIRTVRPVNTQQILWHFQRQFSLIVMATLSEIRSWAESRVMKFTKR